MRTLGIRVILTATLVVAATLTSETKASAAEPVKTTISHQAWNGVQSNDGGWVDNPSCSRSLNAAVWEPAASGRYPVAIVTVGTFGSITAPAYQELAREFGRQGFVAIVADYNTEVITKPIDRMDRVKAKANCTYKRSRPESVMTKVCARAKADCTKGIVTSGHSQGGAMAVPGHDYDSRIAATHVWGTGNDVPVTTEMKSKTRVIAGEKDTAGKTPTDLNAMTGLNCDDQWECFRPNGSGWRRVRDSEVTDGDADHCFTTYDGCSGPIDLKAMDASKNWSYPANVTWLKNFVTP
ncbi:MAG TPA: dienelactone hydrolase family protein [Pseudonocardiaceae bacterium]|nr:dienelactone hydrolase family protein [Pseudonocardiaceae bacterium]